MVRTLCVCICIGVLRLSFFFFQAEDGIRDAQESRGLGDVYKRQTPDSKARFSYSTLAPEQLVIAVERLARAVATQGLSLIHI